MLHDINQVEGVVRDLVEAARPGDLRREPTQVNGIILAALQQLAPQFSHRKVTVRTALDDRLPDVLLDGPRFRQALLNILVNAAEAMPAGGPIAVEARAFDDLSFTHRCEYVDWVEEAKRPETRARRIAGTVERVREGRAPR